MTEIDTNKMTEQEIINLFYQENMIRVHNNHVYFYASERIMISSTILKIICKELDRRNGLTEDICHK